MAVIVNADDYGWNESCSVAILEAFERGYIDSTTAVATGAFFDPAARMISRTSFSGNVGIHFDLTEGTPLTEKIRKDPFFCDENGLFHGKVDRYRKLTAEQADEAYGELRAQAERFQESGLEFHHADSHHHIHTAPYITPIVLKVMSEYHIEGLRLHRNIGDIRFVKKVLKNLYNLRLRMKGMAYSDFFGSFDDFGHFNGKSKKDSVLEIMCHPDFDGRRVLIDRAGDAPYEAPFGEPLAKRNAMIRHERPGDEGHR